MADTTASPNNQLVRFRGQGKAMAKTDAPEVEDVADKAMGRADQLRKRGLISDSQHAELKKKAGKVKKAPPAPKPVDNGDDGDEGEQPMDTGDSEEDGERPSPKPKAV